MNDANLKPYNMRSKKEARENGRKGGIESGKARREKARLRKAAEQFANMPITDEEIRTELLEMGFEEEELINSLQLVYGLFRAAAYKGNVEAFREIKKLLGEEDTPNTDTLERLDEVLNKIGGNIN